MCSSLQAEKLNLDISNMLSKVNHVRPDQMRTGRGGKVGEGWVSMYELPCAHLRNQLHLDRCEQRVYSLDVYGPSMRPGAGREDGRGCAADPRRVRLQHSGLHGSCSHHQLPAHAQRRGGVLPTPFPVCVLCPPTLEETNERTQ